MRALIWMAAILLLGLVPSAAFAGSPHFVANAFTEQCDQTSLTVTGKEAGLGDETQVHIFLHATAECINPGDHHPKAPNKESLSDDESVPVQNGKADFSGQYALVVQDDISPSCTPPMTIVWVDVYVVDATNGLRADLSDCTP